MDIDWNVVRARFSGMTRDELLEEAALHAEDYAPLAQRILEGEALARGITAAQIEARRSAEAPEVVADGIDMPALITSSDEKDHVRESGENPPRAGNPRRGPGTGPEALPRIRAPRRALGADGVGTAGRGRCAHAGVDPSAGG